MIVSLLSSSMPARKVGSSRVKRRSAFPMLASLFESTGLMEREITGSGTCIEVMLSLTLPSVNVSPVLQSMPNMATMSPDPAASMSSISSECMRTRRPIRWSFLVRMLVMNMSRESLPW